MRYLLILAIVALFGLHQLVQAQNSSFSTWELPQYEAANTAKGIAYISADEQEVIRLLNLARLNPQLFADTYLAYYSEVLPDSVAERVREKLLNSQPLPPLVPSYALCKSAATEAYSISAGTKPTYNNADRIHRYLPGAYNYGSLYLSNINSPIEVALLLLANQSNGYQRSLLDAKIQLIGISTRADAEVCNHFVLDFAEDPNAVETRKPKCSTKRYKPITECPPGSKVIVHRRHRFLGVF
jgi:hypothetical protein